MIDNKPLLGRLPREEGKSAVAIIPGLGAAPSRPVEVHNIERDSADTSMYGNDLWGDCVFVMIEKDRVISAEALGVTIAKLSAAQVVQNYCDYNGMSSDPRNAPGPGSDILGALKWAQDHPERFGGSKLLFYGDVPINDESMKQAVAEFSSVCVGVVVYQSMEYGAKVWYNEPRGPKIGGHGIAGGSYTTLYNFIKTWGSMVEINSAGFNTIDELVVCIWDFQWTALTYDRQIEVSQAYTWITGKAWTGPAPVKPTPPPTPTPGRTAVKYTPIVPTRFLDTRIGNGLVGKLLTHVSRKVQIGGRLNVPVTAIAITGNLTVTTQSDAGYIYAGPDTNDVPTTSTLNFPMGDNRANGFTLALNADGTLALTYCAANSGQTTNAILDVTGYFEA
jgi:hypothetical protein